jgi:hypothetical protein
VGKNLAQFAQLADILSSPSTYAASRTRGKAFRTVG